MFSIDLVSISHEVGNVFEIINKSTILSDVTFTVLYIVRIFTLPALAPSSEVFSVVPIFAEIHIVYLISVFFTDTVIIDNNYISVVDLRVFSQLFFLPTLI